MSKLNFLELLEGDEDILSKLHIGYVISSLYEKSMGDEELGSIQYYCNNGDHTHYTFEFLISYSLLSTFTVCSGGPSVQMRV